MNGTERLDDSTNIDPDSASGRAMSLDEIQSAYAEQADTLARFDWINRLLTGRYRRRQFERAEGRVLDVACGTGANFPYLPGSVDIVGIDISPEMLAKARDRLETLELAGTVREMDAQNLDFPDDSFDTVISSLSTCTFPDPIAALREMERVCAPDGQILLVEHGLSDVGPVAAFQRWRADAHYAKAGCRWTQEPLDLVNRAGLTVESSGTGLLGMITTIDATPS